MNDIPCWLYRASEEPKLFLDRAERDACLADGWVDSPAKIPETPQPPPEDPADDRAVLIAEAERLGVDYDKRWGIVKLKAAIAVATGSMADDDHDGQ